MWGERAFYEAGAELKQPLQSSAGEAIREKLGEVRVLHSALGCGYDGGENVSALCGRRAPVPQKMMGIN